MPVVNNPMFNTTLQRDFYYFSLFNCYFTSVLIQLLLFYLSFSSGKGKTKSENEEKEEQKANRKIVNF